MNEHLLLTPGPTQILPEVCASLGRPVIHHRTPKFKDCLKEAVEGLQYVLQTRQDVYVIASSGTGGMEAAVANTLSPGDEVITVDAGKFGARWAQLCEAYGAVPHVIGVEWGKAIDPEAIETALRERGGVKAVFVTLCETSTGVTADIRRIAKIVGRTKAVLVVDGISGIGAEEFQMDKWGVDVSVSGAQKGFMLPPGLSVIAASDKAWELIERARSPRYYLDLRKYRKALVSSDTPFTPATGLVIALNESLRWIREHGLEELRMKYARLAAATQAASVALGLSLFADETCRSNALTAIRLPGNIDGGMLVKRMRDTYGVSIAGGQGPYKGKLIRIAHMGCVEAQDILKGIACLEKALEDMGHIFTSGAGIGAARKVIFGDETVSAG